MNSKGFIMASVFLVACTDSIGTESTKEADTECIFKFGAAPTCLYTTAKHKITVSLVTKKLADDEIELTHARVTSDGVEHVLTISPDVSMLDGSLGSMLFDDINFDGVPDVAVSTSFGVANQYFDYWVYDKSSKKFQAVGNLPKFTIDRTNKKLTANVKISAAKYESQVYSWNGNKLVRKH